ncbi:MAG: 30S ribosomal protein S3 [Candidatus Firestonebacteria bacterium]
MGQKSNPFALRLGIINNWTSRWFAKKNYADLVYEDFKIRKHIKEKLVHAFVAKVEIERTPGKIVVTVHTARPGMIVGKRGAEVDVLRKELEDIAKKEIYVNVQEVRIPELNAQLVANTIAFQLEKRVSYKRVMKKSIATSLKAGAQGAKIMVSGRLGGSEIARRTWFREGRVPAATFRADIDYGTAEAVTTYGRIGVKVWIFKGEILDKEEINMKKEFKEKETK